ncbi:MAG: multidrug ABC transporter substrate-binding protein [Acidobacteria bacterium]|nr:MAG: multidrug ABC transporter substrate-binding protein [Acidobacteriota bacterium]REK07771.1 MAG: multidrug ABC transporter substrate-binding protein [Acidobacteriota bacterium]
MIRPLRTVLRRLRLSPSFSVTATLTLALGIAANVAVFSVVRAVLLEPLPYDEPDRLVGVWHTAPGLDFEVLNQSASLDQLYLDEAEAFESVGMWNSRRVALTGGTRAEEVPALTFTSTVLPLLRVEPVLGRLTTAEDDLPDTPDVVLLTHSTWQRRFGGRSDVLGETMRINGTSREIVGVLPAGFDFLDRRVDLVLPLKIDRTDLRLGMFNYIGIGRLAPGFTVDDANAQIDRLLPLATERYPGPISLQMLEQAGFAGAVRPLSEDLIGNISQTLWILFAAVGMVLLIACANVANLFLVRAETRQRELAVRGALGAGRWRLARELLGESVTLGLLGGMLALPLAWLLLELLRSLEPTSLPRLDSITIDPLVLLFALGISLLGGLLFGLGPALNPKVLRHGRMVGALKEGGRGGAGSGRSPLRAALVGAQVATGLVLLVGSGLLLRSFVELRDVEPGFTDPESIYTFRVAVPSAEVEDEIEAYRLLRTIQEELAGLPGVASVGATTSLTMDDTNSNDALMVEDFPVEPGSMPPVRRYKFVFPGYHETMGNTLRAGRTLTWDDLEQRLLVAVVTEDFAVEHWGSAQAALGRRISDGLGEGDLAWREIVGVVGSIHDDGPAEDTVPTIYWPAVMSGFWGEDPLVQRSLAFALRTPRADDPDLLAAVQEAVWKHNPNLPLASPGTMADLHRASMARSEFAMVMLLLAAVIALAIGAVGVYGVIAYVVAQRRKEFGVRLALGASRRDVRGLVTRYGLRIAVGGTVAGLVLSALVSRAMSSLLFGVAALDPLTFGVVALVLVGICTVATSAAALRAGRVHPTEALRAD